MRRRSNHCRKLCGNCAPIHWPRRRFWRRQDAREQAEALAAEFRAAIGPPRTSEPRREDRFSRTARLRANLSLQSTTFRHAIRLAIAVGAGDALARFLLNPHDIQRTYWLPMTTSLVLKPDFTTTFTRGTLRIVGTLAGLLVATGLFRVSRVGRRH